MKMIEARIHTSPERSSQGAGGDEFGWGKDGDGGERKERVEVDPNFGLSGAHPLRPICDPSALRPGSRPRAPAAPAAAPLRLDWLGGAAGALADESNRKNGVVLKYNEPPEARVPTKKWRLYVFKGDAPEKEPLHIHRQSCYLFGRDRKVADIPADHPSCSSQHAVLQFRFVERQDADGLALKGQTLPYLIVRAPAAQRGRRGALCGSQTRVPNPVGAQDLGSTNGTFLNKEKIEAQRYYELLEGVRLLTLRPRASSGPCAAAPAWGAQLRLSLLAGHLQVWQLLPRVRHLAHGKRQVEWRQVLQTRSDFCLSCAVALCSSPKLLAQTIRGKGRVFCGF